MPDLNRQKLILVEVLIPAMWIRLYWGYFLLNEMFLLINYFLMIF